MDDLTVKQEQSPVSLDAIIADLRGFGIEEFEEILTLDMSGRHVRIKISNIPTDQDLTVILATQELKGYIQLQEIKLELLSRAITWINGVDLTKLTGKDRLVVSPVDKLPHDIQVVLRDTLRTWGVEVVQILWKVVLTHSQSIENRLFEKFPNAAVMTDVEQRYKDLIEQEIMERTRDAIQERVVAALGTDEEEPTDQTKA